MNNAQIGSYVDNYSDEYLEIEEFEENASYVMVSYAHADKHRVWSLMKKMQPDFRIWCDIGIEEGEEWAEVVAKHIKESSCVIVFLSPLAVKSQVVREEIYYSKYLKKNMVIVYLDRCELTPGMQMRIGHLQSIHGYSVPEAVLLKRISSAKKMQSSRKNASPDFLHISTQDARSGEGELV